MQTASSDQASSQRLAKRSQETGTTDPVRDLANQLVRHLGRERALQTCRENQWHGVLKVIDAMAAAL